MSDTTWGELTHSRWSYRMETTFTVYDRQTGHEIVTTSDEAEAVKIISALNKNGGDLSAADEEMVGAEAEDEGEPYPAHAPEREDGGIPTQQAADQR